ncbi:MAG: ATP-dependent helicase/deoxyribonuclease subunit B, partial [Syntrophomonas sp.]|nr:ATP-dependent helicase/deoxyribonuclease subunit B [Syntrophomonas sp.]
MAVRYILGRAGKGKSHLVYQEIEMALCKNKDQALILLVPDQYTLQAERDVISQLNLPGIMRLEVLSFTRLAQNVFSRVGGLTRVFLNEPGKIMVLRRIIDESSPELGLYKKVVRQEGFVQQFSQLLADFKQRDIRPENLQLDISLDETMDQIIKKKLKDIALIYQRFSQYMEGRYID